MSKKKKSDQSTADKAFTRSDKHTLGDLIFEPWTPQREWTAQLMGMAYPNIGRQGRNQLHRSNVYPNAVKDTAIFLWLCTRPDDRAPEDESDEMTVADAERFPEEAAKQARDFGIRRGIQVRDSQQFWDAYNKFWQVMGEVEAARTQPKGTTASQEEEDEDPKE